MRGKALASITRSFRSLLTFRDGSTTTIGSLSAFSILAIPQGWNTVPCVLRAYSMSYSSVRTSSPGATSLFTSSFQGLDSAIIRPAVSAKNMVWMSWPSASVK